MADEKKTAPEEPQRLSAAQQVDLAEELREIEQDKAEATQEIRARRARRAAQKEQAARQTRRLEKRLGVAAAVAVAAAIGAIALSSAASHRAPSAAAGGAAAPRQNTAANSRDGGTDKGKTGGTPTGSDTGSDSAANSKDQPEDVTFLAVGDNLISERLLQQASDRAGGEGYDFSGLYAHVAPFVQQHDVAWIDIETCINDEIAPAGYPTFSTPGKNADDLAAAGFNVFSLANNHTYDLGAAGIAAELAAMQTHLPQGALATGLWPVAGAADAAGTLSQVTGGYAAAGLAEQPEVYYDQIPVFTTEGGRKIAFLTYAEMTNIREDSDSMYATPAGAKARLIYLYESDLIRQQIAAARQQADAVVVACHWGEEDSHSITEAQRTYAQQLADWGADLIVGAHPHVLQDAAWLTAADGRRVFCAYSVGNFCSTQEQPHELIGAALDCTLHFSGAGSDGAETLTVQKPQLVPMVTDYGEGGANASVYLLSDYTEEQAAASGINGYMQASGSEERFSLAYMQRVIKDSVSAEFLAK